MAKSKKKAKKKDGASMDVTMENNAGGTPQGSFIMIFFYEFLLFFHLSDPSPSFPLVSFIDFHVHYCTCYVQQWIHPKEIRGTRPWRFPEGMQLDNFINV